MDEYLARLGNIEENVNDIIDTVVNNIESNKQVLYDVYSQISQDVTAISDQIRQTQVKLAEHIKELEELENYERRMKQSLVGASKSFIHESAQEIYNELSSLQSERRQKEAKGVELRFLLENLQRKQIDIAELQYRTKRLMVSIGAASSFLTGSIKTLNENMGMLKQRVDWNEQVIYAHEMERMRISRELHDTVAQDLGHQVLLVETCEMFVRQQECARALPIITALKSGLRNNVDEIRKAIFDLRPMAIDTLGLIKCLKELCRNVSKKHPGTEYIFEVNGKEEDIRLPKYKEVAIYRIVQESLSNVAHHARAKKAVVRCTITPQALSLLIEDDGVGFDYATVKRKIAFDPEYEHYGIQGMKVRALQIGGEFSFDSKIGHGSRTRVRILW